MMDGYVESKTDLNIIETLLILNKNSTISFSDIIGYGGKPIKEC